MWYLLTLMNMRDDFIIKYLARYFLCIDGFQDITLSLLSSIVWNALSKQQGLLCRLLRKLNLRMCLSGSVTITG